MVPQNCPCAALSRPRRIGTHGIMNHVFVCIFPINSGNYADSDLLPTLRRPLATVAKHTHTNSRISADVTQILPQAMGF